LTDAAAVLERCAALGTISEEPGLLVRRYGTDALRRAHALVGGWMRAAGLDVREDGVGNLIGRRGDGPALLLGSHLDTVRDAGRYDGPLGVLVALAVVERLPASCTLEVVAFADEEGLRFGTAYLGSGAMTQGVVPRDLRDAEGIRLGDLLPGEPAARPASDFAGYVEVHIEQGPVLEQRDAPVGVVTAIAGQTQLELVVTGAAGHAGTVPMQGRRDALAAAAELVLAIEAAGRSLPGLVATAGRLTVEPGARNVIPGRVTVVAEVRHADDDERRAAVEHLRARATSLAAARSVDLEWRETGEQPAVAMDPDLTEALAEAVAATGLPVERLPSGAGHDAAMLAAVTPAAMLFVRCRHGISHHPDEAVEAADVAAAIDVLERFVRAR
jgi:allantoate deiminase